MIFFVLLNKKLIISHIVQINCSLSSAAQAAPETASFIAFTQKSKQCRLSSTEYSAQKLLMSHSRKTAFIRLSTYSSQQYSDKAVFARCLSSFVFAVIIYHPNISAKSLLVSTLLYIENSFFTLL